MLVVIEMLSPFLSDWDLFDSYLPLRMLLPAFNLCTGVNKPSWFYLAELIESWSYLVLMGGSTLFDRLSKVLSLALVTSSEFARWDLSGELLVQWLASNSCIFSVELFFLYSKALLRQSLASDTRLFRMSWVSSSWIFWTRDSLRYLFCSRSLRFTKSPPW